MLSCVVEPLIRPDEYERHEREGAHLSVESGMARGVTSFMNGEASRAREVGTWPLTDAAGNPQCNAPLLRMLFPPPRFGGS